MSIKDHIEAPVEEPDLLGAGERTEEGVPLTGHLAGPVLAPAKLPLLLPALGHGVAVGHTLQVDVNPAY